jgi:glycosyltransferase involved in cell wall biosynthesis
MGLVSLVVATHGRRFELARLLASLARQTDQAFEVLVVDQNPDDRLLGLLARQLAAGLSVRHLRMMPPNLSLARNAGIAHARGDIVGFPDDDCWYEPDTVAAVRSAFAQDARRDGIAGCWLEQHASAGRAVSGATLSYAQWRRFQGRGASSITLFLRSGLLARIGGFDARLGVGQWFGAGEETDLVLRALRGGARIDPWPDARVHHAMASTDSDALAERWRAVRRRGRGTGALYAKHAMGAWVVLRGLAGQVLRPLLAGRPVDALLGTAASWGALEGSLRWRFTQPRQPLCPATAKERP